MNKTSTLLEVKDHSVSGETFKLIRNSELGFLETIPQPSKEKLPEYYKSEDYISHTDAKRNLFEKAYHFVRSISLNKKVALINKYATSEKRLLDFGCGTGDFLQTAKANGWSVTGVEPNNDAREIANKKTENLVYDTAHIFNEKENSFDVITLWHVLEHIPNLEEHLAIFKKLLKTNGTLIVAVPNYKSFDAKYYKAFWAAYDVPRHLWHFNKESVAKLVSKFNLDVVAIKPMWFDAFYVSMLSEKYKTGKMNYIKGCFVGMLSNFKALRTKEVSSLIYIIKNT